MVVGGGWEVFYVVDVLVYVVDEVCILDGDFELVGVGLVDWVVMVEDG